VVGLDQGFCRQFLGRLEKSLIKRPTMARDSCAAGSLTDDPSIEH